MKFSHIDTKATNVTITPKLQGLIDQKFLPLGKYVDNKDEVRCEIELEKIAKQQSGKVCRVEVNLYNGGNVYRVEATEEQFEQAIDTARNELKHELQHVQGKRMSLAKRGSQVLKNMLRFGHG
jgi:ribosomal subunit interface protein